MDQEITNAFNAVLKQIDLTNKNVVKSHKKIMSTLTALQLKPVSQPEITTTSTIKPLMEQPVNVES